jgi:DNA repair protein RecO (recombination protein O)
MSTRSGDGVILGLTPQGENGALVSLLCPVHGKVRGLVKSRKTISALQPLDGVRYTHTRRLSTQLGGLQLEVAISRAHFWLGQSSLGPLAVGWLQEVLGAVLPDEQPTPVVAAALHELLTHWPHDWPANWRAMAQFERLVLAQVGYGLRLADDPVPCPVGAPLAYVSPNSGRAVSTHVGAPYAAQLFTLPSLWGWAASTLESTDAYHALTLTGFFLSKATGGANLPARARLWAAVEKGLTHDAAADFGGTDGGQFGLARVG